MATEHHDPVQALDPLVARAGAPRAGALPEVALELPNWLAASRGAVTVVVVFRSGFRTGVDPGPLAPLGARMYELATAMPGFIPYKDFAAADGETVSNVEFESLETLAAWRNHPEHVEARRVGRVAPDRHRTGDGL